MAQTLKFGNGTWATKKGSTLAYNDEDGNYKPLPFAYTGAGKGTRVNKQGLIEVVENDRPRIDYTDSEDGALLLEPSRTNLIQYSEDFSNAYWTKNGSSIVSGFTSPTGDLNSFKLVESALNERHRIRLSSSASVLNSTAHSQSIFVKSAGRTKVAIKDNVSSSEYASFDLITGFLIERSVGSNFSIEEINGGFYKISNTYTTIGTTAGLEISILNNSYTGGDPVNEDYQGDGTSGVYIFGAQLEQASYATSYIPTQGSAVTRIADSSSQTPPSGIIGQTEGTMFFEIDFANTSGVAGAWSITSGSSANRITMNTLGFSLTQFTLSIAQNYNSSSTKLASTNVTYSDNHKVAIKYSATTLKLFVDGQLADSVATDGFGNYTNFYLGGNHSGVYGGDTRKFIQADLYNTALTDAELIALTK